MKAKILVLLMSGLLGACSSLNSRFVSPMVESPVVYSSQGNIGIGLGSLPGHRYKHTSDASNRPPDLNNPEVESYPSLFVDGRYGLTDRLQVGVEVHPLNFGLEPKAKFQINQDKTQGLQAAVTGRAGFSRTTNDGDQAGEFGPGGYPWEGEGRGRSISAGVSVGHYLSENILVYAGGALGKTWASATIEQKSSNDGSSPQASYKVSDQGETRALGAGLSFHWSFPFTLGMTYTEIDYDKLPTHYENQVALSFGF